MSMVYEGIRIIDFTQMEQGAVGTQVLADSRPTPEPRFAR
jgi:crotonobetainyl-CoA:carnitine CoA-transferase CaiB-like acyl-CoA transferase